MVGKVIRYALMAAFSLAMFLLALFFAIYLREPVGMTGALIASVAGWPSWETNSER